MIIATRTPTNQCTISPAPAMTPETYKRRYGYYPAGYVTPSSVDLGESTSQSGGAQPKDFVKIREEKMELPQVM